jgi:hypothetical protein
MTIRQGDLFDAQEAATLRDQGMDIALDADRVQLWKAKAKRWLDKHRKGYRFTADELVDGIGLPDEGVNRNNVVGAVMRSWSCRGWIIKTGYYKPSTRKRRHASVQCVWEKL